MTPCARLLVSLAALSVGTVLITATGGCVQRRLSITSEPSGALITIGDHEVGRTPLETTFKFHGVYDILVELDGYEPLRTTSTASAPFYEYPGPDIIAEALPMKLENTQRWHYVLEPRLEDQLTQAELESGMVTRANDLRAQLAATPPPPPPKRAWLTGDQATQPVSTDIETLPADSDRSVPDPTLEPAVEPVSEPTTGTPAEPPLAPAAEPASVRPIGRMTPVGN